MSIAVTIKVAPAPCVDVAGCSGAQHHKQKLSGKPRSGIRLSPGPIAATLRETHIQCRGQQAGRSRLACRLRHRVLRPTTSHAACGGSEHRALPRPSRTRRPELAPGVPARGDRAPTRWSGCRGMSAWRLCLTGRTGRPAMPGGSPDIRWPPQATSQPFPCIPPTLALECGIRIAEQSRSRAACTICCHVVPYFVTAVAG